MVNVPCGFIAVQDSDNTYILMKTEGKEKELKNEDEDEE